MHKEKKQSLDGDYPSLHAVSWAIGYVEQLLAIISEPLLIICAVIAFVDFSTHGGLLSVPAIAYGWSAAQGIAIDASLIMTGRRAFKAFSLHYYGRGAALSVLTLVLGIVAWATTDVQSLEQSLNLSVDGALAQIFLSPQMVIHLRSAVAIGMMVVVAVSNHTAVTTAQAPARRIKFFDQLLNRIAPQVEQSEQVSSTPSVEHLSTEQQSASRAQPEQSIEQKVEQTEQAMEQLSTALLSAQSEQPVEHDTDKHEAATPAQLRAVPSPRERVRIALLSNPGVSDRELARIAQLGSGNTAKRHREAIERETA